MESWQTYLRQLTSILRGRHSSRLYPQEYSNYTSRRLKGRTLMLKILASLFFYIALHAHASAQNQPLPICANLQALTAYKMANAFVEECAKRGVKINQKNAKDYIQKELKNDRQQTSSSCNTQCAVLSATNKTTMEKCVEDRSDAFLKGALQNASFNTRTCNDFKSRF